MLVTKIISMAFKMSLFLSAAVFIITVLLNFSFTTSVLTPTSNIKLKLKRYDSYNYTYTTLGEQNLFQNEPIVIKIVTDIRIYYLNCTSKISGTSFYSGTMDYYSEYYYARVDKSTPEMGTTWICLVRLSINLEVKCEFPVHYRAQDVGAVYINNRKIKTYLDRTVTECDEFGVYKYIKGELSQITCQALKPGNVTMVHQAEKRVVVPGLNGNYSSMFLKLQSEHNGGYFDCQVNVHPYYDDLSTTRIYLQERTSDVGYRRFKINDQILLPIKARNDGYNGLYYYNYFDGERVKISTMFDTNTFDVMQCMAKGDNVPRTLTRLTKPVNVTDIGQSVILRKEHNMFRIECSVFVRETVLAQSTSPVDTIAIDFIHYDETNETDFNPVIIGLSWSKILLKYKRNENLSYIQYEYQNNEDLELMCSTKDGGNVSWLFKEDQVITHGVRQENNAKVRSFKMNRNYNKTKISCYDGNSSTRIVLFRKDGSSNITFDEDLISTNSTEDLGSTEESNSDDGNLNETIFITVGILIALIIISFALWMMYKMYKRSQRESFSSFFNYENLPEHKNGPMLVPLQWTRDEPAYSTPVDANVEAMYAKPVPKGLRCVSAIYAEVHFAEPEKETPYAEPNFDKPNVESNLDNPYAEPNFDKTNVEPNLDSPYAEPNFDKPNVEPNLDSSYAELNFDNPNVESNANTQYAKPNLQSPYAEVIPKEDDKDNTTTQYANVEFDKQIEIDKKFSKNANYAEITEVGAKKTDDKYANVFDGQRYGNVHSKRDVVDPAYCEIN